MKQTPGLYAFFYLFVYTYSTPAISQHPLENVIQIYLESDTPAEREAEGQLRRILDNVDLERWLFTRQIRIAEGVIPHSHPVLTVNADYLDDDEAQASMFIHEQLHWFLLQNSEAVESAIARLRRIYPEVPVGPAAGGARSEYSTYLHLLVNTLELDAMVELYDEAVAERVLEGWRHYRWIYGEVLERPSQIREIIDPYALGSPDPRSARDE